MKKIKRRTKRRMSEKRANDVTKNNTKLGVFILLALTIFSFAITIGEQVNSPLPTWQEIYSLAAGESHVAVAADSVENAVAKVHFIDVGQGDATLIEQGGEFCLIDAGDSGSGDTVVNYLTAIGVDELDMIIMTHEHVDHIGGMVEVMENFDTNTVLLPVFSNEEPLEGYTLLRTLEFIDTNGITAITAGAGQEYAVGDGKISVVDTGIQNTDNRNNASIITVFDLGEFSYLSCGDAEKQQSSYLVENGYDLSADIYKAAHHGAENGSYPELLQAVNPSVSVVSCGKDNSYGHPHSEAIAAMESVGSVIYGTHEQGNIIVSYTNDNEIFVTTKDGTEQIMEDAA